MVRALSDKATLDLFKDWEPSQAVDRFDDTITRTATLRARISRAVSETLKACGKSRADIAAEMSRSLGEEVTENMLNNYSSEAKDEQTIPYVRLLALVMITGDARPLQMGAETIRHSIIDDKYLPWIEAGQLADKKDEIARALDVARRAAKKGMRL